MLKGSVLFPDADPKPEPERRLRDEISTLTDQIQCLAQEVAQVKAEKHLARSCFDEDGYCSSLGRRGLTSRPLSLWKGDYYRYLAEFSTETEKKAASDQSLMAYQHAMVVASSELSPAHQIRLGLALNFSVFFYEIMNSQERACQVAKQAFDEALTEISSGEGVYKDSTLMMQLLKDNLALWTLELTGGEASKEDDVDMEG